MEQKIAELTEKIYQEGVEKGEEQAGKIVSEAEEKASKIVTDAKKNAEEIKAKAGKEAEELKRNVESEIKLSGQQAIATIKQQILDLIMAKVVDDGISTTLSTPETIKEYISTIIQNWKAGDKEAPAMEVLLPETKRAELEKAFTGGLLKTLKQGLTVSFSRAIKSGFQIGPENSSFKISLTDEDFQQFFKEYLRPKTRAFLFGEE
ncbi:MAG: V-type ATP synthase subunit E [Chitinivibrionales bacterium]|nr:V-type ATP synthase subunit E [Chitinivibrionales bacterium]